jgi:LmbE family N-acetylglucosaminyl deacetylase
VRRTLLLVLSFGAAGPAAGQFTPPGTGGVAALADALQQLGAEKRVLVIAAHPDDENTNLLTFVVRGLGGRAAYLSLSRGEGGQNLIGPELGVGLGVIRTAELLAARAVDGADQYFTRAYDFGFSRSADEAFRFWPRDSVLADVIDVIRRFRPQVIASVFWGTPRDGHGQHQVAGWAAHEAFRRLADSSWGPVKLYRNAFRDSEPSTLTIPVGVLDPVAGRSYAQIAAASRSRHRSQDMGQLQRPGPAAVRLALVERRASGPDTALFAGVDTMPRFPNAARFLALIDTARARLTPWHPAAVLPYLVRAHALLPASGEAERRATLERAIAAAAGVSLDAVTADGIVAAGERVEVDATVWNAGPSEVAVRELTLAAPAGWTVVALDSAPLAGTVAPGAVVTRRFAVSVPAHAPRTAPYFLRRPLVGALYDWTGVPAEVRGRPFEPPPLEVRARFAAGGATFGAAREVVQRYRDQAVGEVRRPLVVTRPFDVTVTPALVVWPVDGAVAGTARRFDVAVTNRARGRATARVRFAVPDGWRPIPAESLTFAREDETRSLAVTLQAPPGVRPGRAVLRVSVTGADGSLSDGGLIVIDYPHIQPRAMEAASTADVHVARLALPGVRRVGYVRGASDRVPEELMAIGLPLEVLGGDSLARGDLSRYDAIVIGSRAYETEPALVAHNDRLLAYARAGGLVVVQYQQYQFVDGHYAPYPLTIGRPHDRVTDETAPVTALAPDHPLFHTPNEIGPADWEGWVQERGLYFAGTWDSTYVPLLETQDPGGPPLRGGVLVAPVGRGTYVYTGLSFFRQLPAGVPGAYRLFLNLLGLRERHVP